MIDLQPNDVICGRGAAAKNHVGNHRYRLLITLHHDAYRNASKSEKSQITEMVVNEIYQIGGRFLKRDLQKSAWIQIDERSCREKTGHSLREMSMSKCGQKNGGYGKDQVSNRGELLRIQEHLFKKLCENRVSPKKWDTSNSRFQILWAFPEPSWPVRNALNEDWTFFNWCDLQRSWCFPEPS